MMYTVIVEGSFETKIEIEAENHKKAKIAAAEEFLSDFPKPTSFRIEMISVPVDEIEK